MNDSFEREIVGKGVRKEGSLEKVVCSQTHILRIQQHYLLLRGEGEEEGGGRGRRKHGYAEDQS